MEISLDKNFWDTLWQNKITGWDLKQVSPPIKVYIDSIKNKDVSILIPGCGNAYEASYLLENGFTNVSIIDISPTLVDSLKTKFEHFLNKEVKVICGNFFEVEDKYDIIIEQTFFCALDPNLRENYATKMRNLLKDDGRLVGLLFDKTFEQSPPFGGSKSEYQELFGKYFNIIKLESCKNSITPRMHTELWFELKHL
jgi:SAM-dependent methyltransferase